MTATDVESFLNLTDRLGVRVWVDGGWAVDACLGAQTRPHGDLDIALEERDRAAVVDALIARGWSPVPRDDSTPWNFVLGDGQGRQVDLHVVVFDDAGRGVLGPAELGLFYPAGSLTGHGTINGRAVDCVSPLWLVRFHTGYAVDADDWADVSALCSRFNLPIPDDYAAYRSDLD